MSRFNTRSKLQRRIDVLNSGESELETGFRDAVLLASVVIGAWICKACLLGLAHASLLIRDGLMFTIAPGRAVAGTGWVCGCAFGLHSCIIRISEPIILVHGDAVASNLYTLVVTCLRLLLLVECQVASWILLHLPRS